MFNIKNIEDRLVILDPYADYTFYNDKYIKEKKVPIKGNWATFIHHTPNNFSENNVFNLLNNDNFVKSLTNHTIIFVLSEYLNKYVKNYLKSAYDKEPKVITVYHPIPLNLSLSTLPDYKLDPKYILLNSENSNELVGWNYKRYIENNEKKIVNIGAWLRNPYTIYSLKLNNINIQKCKLIGPHMDIYDKPINLDYNDIVDNDYIDLIHKPDDIILEDTRISRISSSNYKYNIFVKYCKLYQLKLSRTLSSIECLYELKYNDNSVDILTELSDDEYIKLLCNNIVFCDFIDCSASNTVVECITFNIPLIVNKHEAIIEYLGEDYPLYYTDEDNIDKYPNITHISKIYELLDDKKILEGHNYLKRMDKTKLDINKFLSTISSNTLV